MKSPLEFALKLLFFNACLYLIYLIYKIFTLGLPKVNIPMHYVVAGLQLVLIIYDYALTVLISSINKRLKIKK